MKAQEREITLEKLLKFIKIRNESNFQTNLQFTFDAHEAGFDISELGVAKTLVAKDIVIGYVWIIKKLGVKLYEKQGKLSLKKIKL